MAQGRGFSAMIFLFCVLVLSSEKAHATTYVVGDNDGWNMHPQNWPIGKNFKAGDILVFNYNPQLHDVVIVDEGGYKSCTVPKGAKRYNSGHDQIKLAGGPTYFICSFPGPLIAEPEANHGESVTRSNDAQIAPLPRLSFQMSILLKLAQVSDVLALLQPIRRLQDLHLNLHRFPPKTKHYLSKSGMEESCPYLLLQPVSPP
ncbi:unnamed protein product [Sphenostylis stenocarpa]|uniref:Basic blue protein n=1 Tax=Sphenostylis stenocarpa TaxID=92480 RepID=A0AA86VPI2_9FABA|nr:unnamed protein product [Sphenostylis stenocarpa]